MLVGLVSSGRVGLTWSTVVGVFDLGGGEVAELAVEALVVEPGHPPAGRELEVIEASPVPSVRGEDGGVAVQFGLVETVDRLGERVVDAPIDVKWFYAAEVRAAWPLGAGRSR